MQCLQNITPLFMTLKVEITIWLALKVTLLTIVNLDKWFGYFYIWIVLQYSEILVDKTYS